MKPAVVFVDFDGTLYKGDSMLDFLKYTVGAPKMWLIFLLYMPAYLISSDKGKVKEKWLKSCWKTISEEHLKGKAQTFSLEMDSKLFPTMMRRMNWHQQEGHTMILLSASLDLWLEPWCTKHGYKLISTQALFRNNRFMGFRDNLNVKGELKLTLAKKQYSFKENYTYAYGNEPSDQFIVNAADKGYLLKHPEDAYFQEQ